MRRVNVKLNMFQFIISSFGFFLIHILFFKIFFVFNNLMNINIFEYFSKKSSSNYTRNLHI